MPAGTGKSRVIAWMREIMETGMGWTHGVQFVFLAFQNVMAAAISGLTLHHWSGIPAHYTEGGGTGDAHALSIQCQAMRVIVIDEVSMISAELLGTFEKVVRKVIRSNGTYKREPAGGTTKKKKEPLGVSMSSCVRIFGLSLIHI